MTVMEVIFKQGKCFRAKCNISTVASVAVHNNWACEWQIVIIIDFNRLKVHIWSISFLKSKEFQ
jgi:hypothetical protein